MLVFIRSRDFRALVPVLLVAVFFLCPLVVWSARGAGTPGVIGAVNRMLQGSGLSVATGCSEDTPGMCVFSVRIEPADVLSRDGTSLAVRHAFQVLSTDPASSGPWLTGGEKGGAIGSMLGLAIDPPMMPSNGLALRCNGVTWMLAVTDEGPVLGPAPSYSPHIEEVSSAPPDLPGKTRPLVWNRQKMWFNDVGANNLINLPGLDVIKRGYVNKSVVPEPPWTNVFFSADVAEDGTPVAGVTLEPDAGAYPWTYLAVALATQPGAPPLVTLYVPEPTVPGMPAEGPCLLDLHTDDEGNGGSLVLTLIDRHTDWEVWWSADGVSIEAAD